MKRVLLKSTVCVALGALLAFAKAGDFGYTVAYDLGRRQVVPAVTSRIGSQHDLLGIKGFDVDVLAIGGADTASGSVTGGLGITKTFKFSRESSLVFGFFARSTSGQATTGGFIFGISGSLGG